MTWLRLDAAYSMHPKVRGLPPTAKWLFVDLLCVAKMFTRGGELDDEHLSPAWLADRTGFDTATIPAALDALVLAGLLDRREGGLRIHGWAKYQEDSGNAERQARHKERAREAIAEVSARAKTPDAERAAIEEIFTHWQLKCGHPDAKLTPDREAKIRARLREGTSVEKAKQAIDGIVARGPVEGRMYHSIGLIFRDAGHVDQYVALANGKAAREPKIGNALFSREEILGEPELPREARHANT